MPVTSTWAWQKTMFDDYSINSSDDRNTWYLDALHMPRIAVLIGVTSARHWAACVYCLIILYFLAYNAKSLSIACNTNLHPVEFPEHLQLLNRNYNSVLYLENWTNSFTCHFTLFWKTNRCSDILCLILEILLIQIDTEPSYPQDAAWRRQSHMDLIGISSWL